MFFKSGKNILLEGCSSLETYFSKNKNIYQKLYPRRSEAELQRLALHDWNEMVPEDEIVKGAVEVERRVTSELEVLADADIFGVGSNKLIEGMNKAVSYKLSKFSRSRLSKKKNLAAKQELRQEIQKTIAIVRGSMETLASVELSEEEHLSELQQLMTQDSFVRKAIDNVDRRLMLYTLMVDVRRKVNVSDDSVIDIAKKLVVKLESFRQVLEKQTLALNRASLELNREKVSTRDLKKQVNLFLKSLPELKRNALFVSKLSKTSSHLSAEFEKLKSGMDAAGFEYFDSQIGLPDISNTSE